MSKLCDNCGHELPNAAGPGLYCIECGEPVHKSNIVSGGMVPGDYSRAPQDLSPFEVER